MSSQQSIQPENLSPDLMNALIRLMDDSDRQDEAVVTGRWVSVVEIATHLGVRPDTVYKWIDRKNLPGHKVGRLWKFRIAEVDQWVRSGNSAADRALNHKDVN